MKSKQKPVVEYKLIMNAETKASRLASIKYIVKWDEIENRIGINGEHATLSH